MNTENEITLCDEESSALQIKIEGDKMRVSISYFAHPELCSIELKKDEVPKLIEFLEKFQ